MSPLSTTTTRRTSCTLATRIPPNYEPGSRFRVLAPDGSEVDVMVPAGAEAGDEDEDANVTGLHRSLDKETLTRLRGKKNIP